MSRPAVTPCLAAAVTSAVSICLRRSRCLICDCSRHSVSSAAGSSISASALIAAPAS
jgi:hypothetical protein